MGEIRKINIFDYYKHNPMAAQVAWQVMEEMHELYPYVEMGWDGFIPFIFYRINS